MFCQMSIHQDGCMPDSAVIWLFACGSDHGQAKGLCALHAAVHSTCFVPWQGLNFDIFDVIWILFEYI